MDNHAESRDFNEGVLTALDEVCDLLQEISRKLDGLDGSITAVSDAIVQFSGDQELVLISKKLDTIVRKLN